MKINKAQIKALDPCLPAWTWYLETKSDKVTDLKRLLLKTNKENPSWARWLFTHLMTSQQRREIAIYAAEQVLPLFEKRYPNDNRPRAAIEAARRVLENDTAETRQAARNAAADAAYAAYAAADAAVAAYDAAAAVAYAAYAYDAAAKARKGMQEAIIKEAVRILDRDTKLSNKKS